MTEREDASGRNDKPVAMIVEDEAFIALDLERRVKDAGFDVLGPFPSVAKAMTALETSTPDVAILDFSLAGETSEPIADALSERNVRFAFMTGYAVSGLMEKGSHAARPRLSKPSRPDELEQFLHGIRA